MCCSGRNIAIGDYALYCMTTACDNIMLGEKTGCCNITGSGNIFIGKGLVGLTTNTNCCLGIGNTSDRWISGDSSFNVTIAGIATVYAATGIVSATKFCGDGSCLTGISGGGGSGINTDAQNNHYGIDQNAESFSGTDATDNTLFGHQAGYKINTGDKNVVVGSLAGDALTSGCENVYVGYNAGSGEDTQTGDVALGAYALQGNNAGNYNTALGYRAGTSGGSSSDRGVYIGYWAGPYVSGDDNISIGNFSMGNRTTTGSDNIAIGRVAGYDLGSGKNNTLIGDAVGYSIIGGCYNTFIGDHSGFHFDNDASSNIAIGRCAGMINVDGNNNTIIGSMEYTASTTMHGQVAIGAGTTELVRINDTGLGIGTDIPDSAADSNNTQILNVGVVTANYFYGDGSNLTGISGGGAGFSPDADENLIAGTAAGASVDGTNSCFNIFLGACAGNANVAGANSIFLGYQAWSIYFKLQ